MMDPQTPAAPVLYGRGFFLWGALLALLCVLPGILMAAGMDLSSEGSIQEFGEVSSTEQAYAALRGPLIHTLLEWSSFCAAVGVCCLAMLRYRLTHERSMLLISMAFACAGSMDAFHTLAADRLTSSVAANQDLIPFTWALCRLFTALILMAGVGLHLLLRQEEGNGRTPNLMAPTCCLGFVLLAYASISFCANSTLLPNTIFAQSTIKRPYDLAALIPFVLSALLVFPRYVRISRSIFAKLLFLSLMPQVATQLYMAFGSSALFDAAFNAAHLLKAVAYIVPFTGLILEHVRIHGAFTKHSILVQASEIRMEAIMEAVTDALVVIDHRGVIESCNVAAADLFQYDRAELLGQNVSILTSEPHRERHNGYLDRFLKTRAANIIGTPREVLGMRKDGSLIPVRLSVNEVELAGATLFVGLLHDLTQERELQARLSQSQKLESIGQLAAGIAHEINTPTQFANDNVQFLGSAADDLIELVEHVSRLMDSTEGEVQISRDEVQEFRQKLLDADYEFLLEEIPRAAEQSLSGLGSIGHIVRAMKEFSHPGGVEKVSVDLNRTIESTVTVARNEWKYAADLKLDLEPTLPAVPCVQGEFNQVILNLVVNAAHAIEESHANEDAMALVEKGTITVSTRLEDDWVEVIVRDDGTGMDRKVSERIFDPFFTTKGVGRGTGQGLAIAHAVIVEKHQGTLRVESELGKGSAFVIRLPLEPEFQRSDARG